MSFGGLGQFANTLVATHGFTRIAAVTSTVTGNPALRALDLTLPRLFVSVQYDPVQARPQESVTAAVQALGLSGELDLVVADPYHTYESSVECLAAAATLLRPGGVILVHDCLPPLTMTSERYQPGLWSGVTYAAFRDVCQSHDLRWCTIDADFGVGVAVVDGAVTEVQPTAADLSWSREQFEANPWVFMRAVAPDNSEEAVQRLLLGQSVNDLLESSASDPPPSQLPPEVIVQMLAQKVSILQEKVAHLTGESPDQ